MLSTVQCLICKRVLTYDRKDTKALVSHIQKEHPNLRYKHSRRKSTSVSFNQSRSIAVESIDMSKKHTPKPLDISTSEDSTQDAPDEKLIHSQLLEPHAFNTIDGHIKPGVADKVVQTSFDFVCPEQDRTKTVTETVLWKAKERKNPNESLLNIEITKETPKNPVQSKYEVKGEFQAKPPHETYYKTRIEHTRKSIYKIRCPHCGFKGRPVIFCNKEQVTSSAACASILLKCWTLCFLPSMFPPPSREHIKCAKCNYFLGVYDHQKQVVDFRSPANSDERERLINE